MGSTKFDDNNDRIRQKRYTCKLSKLNIIQDEGGGGGGGGQRNLYGPPSSNTVELVERITNLLLK